jgi:hypothetical protein
MEKNLDAFITEKMAAGLEDGEIFNQFTEGYLGAEPAEENTRTTPEDRRRTDKQDIKSLRKRLLQDGEEPADFDRLTRGGMAGFEDLQQKLGKDMYERDRIILGGEELGSDVGAAVKVSKEQREIEPPGEASYRSLNSEIIDPKTFRPDQPDFSYDPKAERRAH